MKKALLSCKNRSAEIVSPAWIRRLFCLFYKLSRTKMLLIPEHILVQDLKCAKAEDEALKCRWGCVKSNIISWTPFDRNREESRGYLRDGLHLLLLCVGSSAVQHLEEVWRLGSHTCVNVGLRKRRDVIQCQSQPYDVKCLVSSVGTFPLVARLRGRGGGCMLCSVLIARAKLLMLGKNSGCLFSKFTSSHF